MSRAWQRLAMTVVLVCGCAAPSAQILDPNTGMTVDPATDPIGYANVISGLSSNPAMDAINQMLAQQKAAADTAADIAQQRQAFQDFVNSTNPASQNDTPPAPAIPQTAAPSVTPSGGSFKGQVMVTILDRDPNAALHYTLDGSKPGESSPDYAVRLR